MSTNTESYYDDVRLKCTYPGCGEQPAQIAARVLSIEAMQNKIEKDEGERRRVKVADLANFVLCKTHARKSDERGVSTYWFKKTLEKVVKDEAEQAMKKAALEAEADRKRAAEERAETAQKEAQLRAADERREKQDKAREDKRAKSAKVADEFFGKFMPKDSELGPRRPELTRQRA